MTLLNLKVTDQIMHRKRGSTYTIIGKATYSPVYQDKDPLTLTFSDGGIALLAKHVNWGSRMSVSIPGILFQLSNPSEAYNHPALAFVYRLDTDRGMIFARPTFEFTDDRFVKVGE